MKKQFTLLIGLGATVNKELAVSDKVLDRLNNIGFNGHIGESLTKNDE